jgi:DNA ligase D-like protein (predicted polymerase)
MASDAVEIEAGGRTVRVSSPTRVIYEATDFSAEVTKLMVAEYYVAVEDGLMRALRERPVALERWPKGVREDMVMSTRADSHGDAFYQKRMMRGAPPYVESTRILFPSGRVADEICMTEIATAAWAAHMGAITFHPWPTRRADNDRPDELRIDLDPFGAAGFADAVRIADVARELFAELGIRAFAKTSGKRGIHVYARIEPRWTFTDVRHAAIAFARELEGRTHGVTTAWWKEERADNVFVDYNQNCRDRTIASAYSLRPAPGATVSTPIGWDELATLDDPRVFTLHTVPDRLAKDGDPWAEIDDVRHSLRPLLDLWDADPVELPYPPEYPKMPGEPKRVQPSKAKKVVEDA